MRVESFVHICKSLIIYLLHPGLVLMRIGEEHIIGLVLKCRDLQKKFIWIWHFKIFVAPGRWGLLWRELWSRVLSKPILWRARWNEREVIIIIIFARWNKTGENDRPTGKIEPISVHAAWLLNPANKRLSISICYDSTLSQLARFRRVFGLVYKQFLGSWKLKMKFV